MPRRAFSTPATARRLEDVFLERYGWLRSRALALVEGDRAAADDLVHDVFVELRLGGIDPDEIRDPEAYLFRTLRNIHISAIRRAARAPVRALSVVDYDSLDVLLADTRDDPAHLLENSDDVRRVCAYACRRKETSKAGSALILRFFHGYTPQATATLMRVSAAWVDQLLSLARSEARVFVRDPVEDLGRIPHADSGVGRDESSPDDLLVSLRRTILTARQGACLSEGELAEWESAAAASVERQRLAHLVSCRVCMEAVTGRTGLPSPWNVSSDGDDKGDQDGRWSGDTRRHWRKAKGRQRERSSDPGLARLRTVLEHRPRTLQVMVNGFLVGSQTVSHEPVTQTVQVGLHEAVGFIEVFADERVRLLMMAVDPPPAGDVEQVLQRHFGQDRALTVVINFAGPTPRISVTYEPAAGEQVELVSPRLSLHPNRGVTETRTDHGFPWFSWPAGSWGTAFAKAVAIAVVCWLLIAGGGGAALASAAEHIAQAVRSWISSLTSPSVEKSADDDRRGLSVPVAPRLASTSPVAAKPPTRAVALDAVTRAGVELDVLRALQPVHAYIGQEITIGSTAGGRVLVEGLAADPARKRAVLAALTTLPTVRRRLVSFEIRTVDEAVRHAEAGTATSSDPRRAGAARDSPRGAQPAESIPSHPRTVSFRDYVVIADRFPAFDRARAALAADVSTVATSTELDQRAHQFASHVLDVSRSASRHAAALQQIATRVTPAIEASLSASARASLTAVVDWHADRFEHDLRTLGDALARVYDRPGTAIWLRPHEDTSPDARDGDARDGSVLPMWAVVDRMATLNATRVYAVSRAFSVSAEGEADAGMVASGDFWALMDESIQVARALRVP